MLSLSPSLTWINTLAASMLAATPTHVQAPLPERLLKPILDQVFWREYLPTRMSLICLLMLFTAVSLWLTFGRRTSSVKVTAVYWLACGLSVLLTLSFSQHQLIMPAAATMIAAVSLAAAYLPWWHYKRIHNTQWFIDPACLKTPYVVATGLVSSMTALGIFVFVLNLSCVTSFGAALAGILFAFALFIAIDHSWREEAAFVAIILLTQGVLSLILAIASLFAPTLPTLLNAIVLVLAMSAGYWAWLGRVWRQQILDHVPLTTAAKLVPLTHHASRMLLLFSTLLLLKVATWPLAFAEPDAALLRTIFFAIAAVILLAVNFKMAQRDTAGPIALLFMFNIFFVILAYVVRSDRAVTLVLSNPAMSFAGLGLMYILVAVAVQRARYDSLTFAGKLACMIGCPLAILLVALRVHDQIRSTDLMTAGSLLIVAWGVLKASAPKPQLVVATESEVDNDNLDISANAKK